MIPQSFIFELMSRVDVVDVVGRYVQLRKAGSNFLGLCPFHGEKSASFTVTPSKQFYHCFGCGAHGSAISFLMEHAGMTFPEAVADLAQGVGLAVPQESASGPQPARRDPDLLELMSAIARFYRQRLRDSPRAVAYLKGRGLTGETAARLELLFVKLGFHEVSKRRLREKRWDKVAKGMRELSLMNVREAEPLISPFLKSKNDILRKEARVALVNLSVKDHLSFLSRETEPLTDWDQAVIYSMMSKMPELSIPDFSAWLDSKNPTVVEFCISMIGAFRQQESLPILIRLLNDPVEKRKLLAIRALRELGAAAAEQPLLDLYPSANSEMRREILRTLEVIGSERSLQPIHQLLLQPVSDLPLAIQAVRSLLATGPRGVQLVEQLSVHGDPKIQQVIRHARDKRL